jgi:hypothetical protein
MMDVKDFDLVIGDSVENPVRKAEKRYDMHIGVLCQDPRTSRPSSYANDHVTDSFLDGHYDGRIVLGRVAKDVVEIG